MQMSSTDLRVDVLDAAMGLVMAFSSPGSASKGTDLQFMDMVAELNRLLDADRQYLQPCSITHEVQAIWNTLWLITK